MKNKEFKTAKECFNYLIKLALKIKLDKSLYPLLVDNNTIKCHSKIFPATGYGQIKTIVNFKFPECEGYYTLEF